MSFEEESSQNIVMDVKEKCLNEESPFMKHFIKLVNSLNTDSNQGVEKALIQIRSDIMKNSSCIKYLCDSKALVLINKYLKFPNERILNLSLSILATCCVEEEPRLQMMECQAIPQVASVLKTISQDGVQNRACRLVANLAQSKEVVHALHSNKVVEPIVAILNSNSSSGTQQSAIRALRILWESLSDSDWCIRGAMLRSAGAAKVVGEYLKSENKDVVQNALKALKAFTEHRDGRICDGRICASQFNESVYKIIVALLPDPIACQVAINLSKTREGLLSLNNCFAVRSVVTNLAASTTVSASLPASPPLPAATSTSGTASSPSPPRNPRRDYLLTALLCQLCSECSGRVQLLKLSDGPTVFLTLLETQRNRHIRAQLYNILMHFSPEPATLKFLTRNGLVRILVDKLERCISKFGQPHRKPDKLFPQSPTNPVSVDEDGVRGGGIVGGEGRFSPPQTQTGLSPMSSDSALGNDRQSLGSLSPLSDPGGGFSDRGDCSPPLAYSPVCSSSGIDSDDEQAAALRATEEVEVQLEVEVESSYETFELSDSRYMNIFEEDSLVSYFLDKLSHIPGTVEDLASERTIEIILKYKMMMQSTNLRVVGFLQTIATKQQYYCKLLDEQFALKVSRKWCRPLHLSAFCNHCDQLQLFGERVLDWSCELSQTGLGEGQMAHRLLKAPPPSKFHIACTVPLVARDYKLLVRLLFKYNAYEIMTAPLQDCSASPAQLEDIAFGIRALFRTLCLQRETGRATTQRRCRGCDIMGMRRAASVTFALDDGSLVPACKAVLCEKSPVFEAMFRGGFRESEEKQVRVSDVTSECLEHFVRLVDVYCECTLPGDVATLLELVAVADRYLIAGLSTQVLAHIMNVKLNYRSCQVIYEWAIESKLPLAENIASDVIKYIFTAKMTRYQVKKSLLNMLGGVHKECFLKHVANMIKAALNKNNNNFSL